MIEFLKYFIALLVGVTLGYMVFSSPPEIVSVDNDAEMAQIEPIALLNQLDDSASQNIIQEPTTQSLPSALDSSETNQNLSGLIERQKLTIF